MRSYRVTSGFALMLVGSIAAAACSGKVAPAKGQVMVVLQSDMSIPKDFNRVRVDISVRGQKAFSETYIADESGGITLPGTIAVVAGEEDAPPIEVNVVGINRDGEAQTFSKAVTTIPRTRIATLRIPMQWLCTGQVLQIGEGADAEFESRCNPEKGVEKACVAGSCVPVDIPEQDLPTYSPPDVFGGGQFPNDPSGECFDVQACFKLGVDLQPDLDPDSDTYCQAAIAVPEDFEVNFAVKTPPGGAGVCDDDDDEAPCYVVLDQSETFGWTPLEGAAPPVVDGGTGGTSGDIGVGGQGTGTGGAAPPSAGAGPSGGAFPSAGAASGGSATAGAGGGPPVFAPKRVTTGGWFGDVFTFRSPGSNVMLDGADPGFPICVSGTVGPTANDYALVGFYLQQDAGSDAQFISPVDPGAGVHIQITDNLGGGTPLRAVLVNSLTPPTATSGYCTNATEGPIHYLWSGFDQNCESGGDGPFFDGSVDQLVGLAVAVPGSDGPIPFDFCIEDVMEDLPVGQRLAPGQQTQSIPAPPGVKPQQSGGAADGSVVVQFPTAVCDRLNEDPELRLRGTAACDKKTEQVPICGPWSSVPAPQVPNPDGMLPGGSGEGGAGGMMSGGDAGGEGGRPNAVIVPGVCKAPEPAEHANPGIASFDADISTPDIDVFDNRTGRAFSVGHGVCEAGQLTKLDGGAQSTPMGLRLSATAQCDTSTADGNSVALVVPLSATPSAEPDGPPRMMCVYDSSFYTGFKFWAKDDQSRELSVTLLTPDNVPIGDPVPGGACEANCNLVRVNVPLTANWQEFSFPFNQFEVDPSALMAIKFEPLATSEIYFDIDEIHFIGGTLP